MEINKNITVEPLFKIKEGQYIYSFLEDSKLYFFLNVIMQVWKKLYIVLSARTSDSSVFLNAVSLKVCIQLRV
jgi:hypothetical protein